MTESDTPSLVFRNTSFTMRQRFTPASACSTRTRMRANFRFVRFSAAVNSPRGGFFFRLVRFLYRGLVPLESSILVQHRPRWIGEAYLLGDRLVGRLADVGATPEVDRFASDRGHDHVLVAVC